ncbi:oligopeptide/dipeptide ABC transporter, ATP-binding protein [Mesotoga prima MesG1.Ag.4.2]|uniref:Oligopeptide/dipeptide ABC transporter, ATP-binding protein n=1 Tax=Mesotoga prima MesG1.Ag.4.2 TaxID=660470 RepID=I2F801_9BACT|nr:MULTISPECIES: oligopeptide/dipeptide ABC transporter ATP-binding protein [Mesotoga]AFK08054.1 oligopeptide/dipeptide ABC transporter, ATP-binding protein [Mesotoga prima MesG1.Ag.4.2]PIJ62802.1 peptide ABC transporter ATPase [Mesotoga sp. H07.pep.5.3]HNS35722.1 ATP-binding cassette domain-containing protein [Mesotoga sp.]
MAETLIKIRDLKTYFPVKKSIFSKKLFVRAVDNVNMDVPKGSTFAVVGESGSGKTTLARTVLRLIEPTSGEIEFDGKNILGLKGKDLLEVRRNMQIVFQDPYNSLHPRKLIKNIIGEGMKIHFKISEIEIRDRIASVLKEVGLIDDHMYRYAHEFSGGQRQRIAFARAIVLKPKFIVLDEPTSALDVSVQAMVLKMLKEIKVQENLTYMFITHNLSLVDYIADKVAVMYVGEVVEMGDKATIFNHPAHPYTDLLMASNPIPDPKFVREKRLLKGEIPSSINPPSGCRFHNRCPFADERCAREEPELREIKPGHFVRCHYPL